MGPILETAMLVCFGFSWPFNVIKAFEILCMTLFLAASIVWLVSATKRKSGFDTEEKVRTVGFTIAYLLAFLCMTLSHNTVAAVVCLAGLAASDFTIASVFYDYFKDKEIMYE